MIVVTGANGQLGRGVVEALLARRPAGRIVAGVRDPQAARTLAERGVQVRRCDFADAAETARAFEGAERVLVVSVNQVGEAARRMHRTAFEAAHAAGARRVFYTSHSGARDDPTFAPAAEHHAAEMVLAEMGGTALRHGFYAESALHLIGRGFETGEIRAPEDGPVAWTARADLAEADAVLLEGDATIGGATIGDATPPLTAAAALTLADVAAIASELLGREVRRVVVSDADWVEAKIAAGVPAPMAEMLVGTFHASRRGDFAATDPALAALLGRAPRTMREVLAGVLVPGGG